MRSSSPEATGLARLARAPFTSTLPPSMAAAACARVLKKRAAQSQVSRRTVSLAMPLQCNASRSRLDLHAPLPVPDFRNDVLPLEPRRPDRDTAQLDAAVPRPDVDVRAALRRHLDGDVARARVDVQRLDVGQPLQAPVAAPGIGVRSRRLER